MQNLNIATLLQTATKSIDRLDAEVLLAYVLREPRSALYRDPERCLTSSIELQFNEYVKRRHNQEPLAYIIGQKEFWSLTLDVSEHTLIPRPETELLVETILTRFDQSARTIADIGTGSGAIAIALAKERPQWEIIATDISPLALKTAKRNAKRHNIKHITFYAGHFLQALPKEVQLDVLVSNPPYLAESEWQNYFANLRYEPKIAFLNLSCQCTSSVPTHHSLLRHNQGLCAINEIINTAKPYLNPNGEVFLEHGFLQGPKVCDIFRAAEYSEVQTLKDFARLDRITYGKLKVTCN